MTSTGPVLLSPSAWGDGVPSSKVPNCWASERAVALNWSSDTGPDAPAEVVEELRLMPHDAKPPLASSQPE